MFRFVHIFVIINSITMKAVYQPIFGIFIAILILSGCTKNDGTPYGYPTSTVPDVSTTAVSNIGSTTATGGGRVTGEGSGMIAKGVCWDTTQYPNILSPHTNDGTGLGYFTSSLTGLKPNTVYYVMAYASSKEGTGYGQVISFRTTSSAKLQNN